MADSELSLEERILHAMKLTLANVIKDTATPHGMRHPLSGGTIQDLRQCLALIDARERELAGAVGRTTAQRPHFADEPANVDHVVRFHKMAPSGDKT
ncbi:MAG: segregation and condensation protein A [Betaproteobacteria bacterium]